MKPKEIELRLGRIRLRAPVYHTEEATRALAADVNRRLKEIEAKSQRVDTQAFALLAALSFAADVEDLKEAQHEETSSVLVALDQFSETLDALLDEYGGEK